MAGRIADLHQVDAALYRRRDQARSQAVPAKGRRVEAKLGGGSLYHAGDVAGSQSLIPYPLGPPIENAPKDSPFADTGRLEPSLKGTDRACDLAPRNAHLAAEPLLIGFTAPYCDQCALGSPLDVA